MNNKGWTKIHREQFSHWISKKPFCDGYAWTYLCNQSNHKKGMVNFRNEYIEVERGRILTSKLKLQEIFGWTYRHVENFLLALKNDEMITYRTTNRYIVITIVKYSMYQDKKGQSVEQTEEQVKNRLGTEQEQIRNEATQTRRIKNDKNVNNEKNGKNEDSKSEEFLDKNSVVYQLTMYLEGKIKENNSSVKQLKESQLQSWCQDIDKLLRLDKANPDDVKRIIDWVVKDDFWAKNVMCAKKLRKHYSRFYKEVISESISDPNRFDFIDEEENLIG